LPIAAGLNRNYVAMIEQEENAPTVDTSEDLAMALDVSVIDLVRNGPR
jgi:transcriptional regulator with XRE-family HTH domain